MKKTFIKTNYWTMFLLTGIIIFSGCKEKEEYIQPDPIEDTDFVSNANILKRDYMQTDQVGRPAINTVFVSSARKDEFNVTTPTDMGPAFAGDFQNVLQNFGYQTNILGLDAGTFASILATDVLNVDLNNASGFGGLNGRTLGDDVIDIELTLIFGGSDGKANPQLTSDGVDANDKNFSKKFPYLASPHRW